MSFAEILKGIENFVWGIPLLVIIIAGGLLLTVRLKGIQIVRLPLALKWMFSSEEGGNGQRFFLWCVVYGTFGNNRYG